jgi:predicted deacetylase
MRALISIHDVMPETLERVGRHVHALHRHGLEAATLLVVPGRAWGPDGLRQLARWQREGLELAAHGWHHRARRLGGPYHWLHSALISRRAAEHLALPADGIARLMQCAHDWFGEQGLTPPTTYVPPAWALGPLARDQRRALPYQRIEVTQGMLDTASERLRRLPLTGFEADTAVRAHFLRYWNEAQVALARGLDRPLRIGIHPADHELRLAGELEAYLAHDWQTLRYCDDDRPET